MILQFADRAIPYERFLNDVARRVASIMKSDLPEFISQNAAYRRFGRRNVDRWRRQGKIEPYIRPGKLEYRTEELIKLKETHQDYFS